MTAPTYELSKFLSNILQQSVNNTYSIRNSEEFCEFINSSTVGPGYAMVSFDVVSLFTNIPLELVRKGILNQWNNIKEHTNINLDLFLEIVVFVIEASYFVFQQKHYQQISGTAMGNPLSPVLAEIVTGELIDAVLSKLGVHIPILKKFVDDFFIVIPANEVDTVLGAFNDYHPKLQFTVEYEVDGRLPFLDMVVVRNEDQSFSTDWFMKPIASGRILNYFSLHPKHLKINVAYNFVKKVNTLSTIKTEQQKKETVMRLLKLNDYPVSLINRLINRHNERRTRTPTQPENDDQQIKIYKSIPYIVGLSQQITQYFKRSNEFDNINIVHYNNNTVGSLYRAMKGRTDTYQRNNVIYCIGCQQCDAKYVGMTTNKLQTRMYGHKSDVNLLDKVTKIENTSDRLHKLSGLKERTAMMNHCVSTGHRFDLQNASILDHSLKTNRLPILEVCHIMTTQNINKRTDVEGLHTCYTGIMHTLNRLSHRNRQNRNDLDTNTIETDEARMNQNDE
ncbi:uncharacterized protein LOC134285179 [Aedes albopictus]|uniref:Reverse transcriptase domain-containing protein n=1 Tax=Aedes albopictus TaxID=7160 RepID=A0ABM1YHG0_AEDAL